MDRKVLVSVTTAGDPHWHNKIKEISEFKITEFALFVTVLHTREERERCYTFLRTLGAITIPFVHARSDMDPTEYQMLIDDFGTQYFNIHPLSEFPITQDLSPFYQQILIENGYVLPTKEELETFGGICLDLSHMASYAVMNKPLYQAALTMIKEHGVIANHLSGLLAKPNYKESTLGAHTHHLDSLDQLDYLNNLPNECFGQYLAIELANPIKEQLKAKEYLETILAERGLTKKSCGQMSPQD